MPLLRASEDFNTSEGQQSAEGRNSLLFIIGSDRVELCAQGCGSCLGLSGCSERRKGKSDRRLMA